MFTRTLDNTRRLTVDILTGVTFNDLEAQIVFLGTSGINTIQDLNSIENQLGITTTNIIGNLNSYIVSIGVSFNSLDVQLDNYVVSSGISISNIDSQLDAYTVLNGVSIDNLQVHDQFLQNEIDALVLTSVSQGHLDYQYGISIAILDSKVGSLIGITSNNLEIHKQDKLQCGISFDEIQYDIDSINNNLDTVFDDLNGIGVSFATNNYLLSISFADITSDINTLNGTIQTELDTKASADDLDSLESIVTGVESALAAVDAAFTAFDVAQTLWNLTQTGNNTGQQTEIDTLQGQHDSLEQRVDTIEEQLGTSFSNTNSHFGVLEEFKTIMLSTTIPHLDHLVSVIGVSSVALENNKADKLLFGSSSTNNTNRIDNIIGVTVYNIDVWKSQMSTSGVNLETNKIDKNLIGITLSSIGTSFSGINSLGISHKNLINDLGTSSINLDTNKLGIIVSGITFTSIGTSYSGLVSMGISHGNLISSLGVSSSNLESNKLGIIVSGITFTSIGTSFSGINSLGISQKNLIIDIGTSSGNLESNKLGIIVSGITFMSIGASFSNLNSLGISQKNLITDLGVSSGNLESNKLGTVVSGITFTSIGTSFSNLNSLGISRLNLINTLGTSSGNLESNKIDKLLAGTSLANLSSYTYSLNNASLGVSLSNVDSKVGNLIGITTVNYLQRNEIVLPNSFVTIGTTASNRNLLTDEYLIHQSNNANCFTQYRNTNGKVGSIVGNINGDLLLRCCNDSTKKTIIQNAPGTQLTSWANNGLLLHEYDLSISGVLQSPLTSLLGVSVGNTDTKIGTIIGTTLNQKYLQRNENVVPATFFNYLLNDNLTFNAQANTNSYIQFSNTVTANNSFYIGKVGSSDLVLNTTGAMIFKKNGTENNRIDTSGHWINSNNLTVSGVLQSPVISLLGVSISNVINNNSSFITNTTWGTTATEKTIKTNSNVLVDAQNGQNSFIYFRNTGTGGSSLFGQIDTIDCFTRLATTSSIYKIQNSAGTNKLTLDSSGNLNLSGECNIASGNTYKINGTSILSSSSLASSVVNSSLTSIGVLNNGTDPLQITNSGNVNFKMTAGSYTYRMEVQTDDEFYLWDGANNEVFHVSSDNQVWFQSDVNCAGTYYDSGIPIVPSSRSLKANIRDLPKDKILDKVEFKCYTKTYKDKTYSEVGIIIEDLLEIKGIENYDLVHIKESDNTKFLKYVPFFMIMISELRDEINELKEKSK